MNVKISVVVPVFNMERYLKKCIDSICRQTFEDIEIICVDDCSTDNSWNLLQELERSDPRIRIYRHSENLGLGGARNTAIKLARGDYLASVDSDDYIAENMLEKLFIAAKENDSCIVVCGFHRVAEDGSMLKSQKFKVNNLVNENNSLDIFSTCNPAFWNKLWKRSLFIDNDIFFPNYVYYQDLATTPRILTKAKKISFVDDCLYYYLIRNGSATYSNTPKHVVDYYTVFSLLREFLRVESLDKRYIDGFYTALQRACKFRSENIINAELNATEKKRHLSHLAAMFNYFHSVDPVTKNFDPESYLSYFDNYPPKDKKKKILASVLVKTICRPDLLERFLISAGAYQEKWGVAFNEIIVGDDSPAVDQKINKNVIERVLIDYPDLNIKYLSFDYDIGCSAGRNKIVQAAISEYVLQCDDDFIIDDQCDFSKSLDIFISKNIDIMGGWLKNKYNIVTGEYEYRAAIGNFIEDKNVLKLEINENKYKISEFSRCHFIMNFFWAKRDALIKNPWDADLKTEEHHEFFYRAYKNNISVGFSKSLFSKHTYEKNNNSSQYNAHRFEKERWKKYLFLSLKKCGVEKRSIETIKHGRRVIWDVDRVLETSKERTIEI